MSRILGKSPRLTPVRYRGVAEDEEKAAEADHVIGNHSEILELLV